MEIFEEYDVEMEIDCDKTYCMPNYVVKEYDNKFLVIAPDLGAWLVFDSKNEMDIFEFLAEGNSIDEALKEFPEDDVINVLSQIEAKNFVDQEVVNIENGETMQIYLTNGCNLRCKHCYIYAESSLENELTFDEIVYLCENFKKNGGQYITFTGGEVSIRKDFPDILKAVHKIGLGIHILSNGTLWGDELINVVEEIKPERVQISLDGFDEETNAAIRGEGCFQKALQTIEKLLEKRIKVYVAVTPLYHVIKENKTKYIKFAKQLLEKYKDYDFCINFSYELLEGREIEHVDLKRYKEEYLAIMEEICESVYPGEELNSFIENHIQHKIFNNCGYGRINVSAVGDVYFCSRIPDVKKYANIRTDSFEKIKMLMDRCREISDVNQLEPCKVCELKYICGGGCRVDNFTKLTQLEDLFDEESLKSIKRIPCSLKYKEYFYRMMIDSNERLYE